MTELAWASKSVVTWGKDETPQALDSWGQHLTPHIQVVDPGVPLSELTTGARSPMAMWKTQPSLRKVVSFAARNVASVPLHVYIRESDTSRQRDANGAAEGLLRNPSQLVTGPKLLHDVVVDLMLYDRWMITIIDGELRRIPAKLIQVEYDFLGGITSLGVSTPKGVVDVTGNVLAYDSGWADSSEGGVSPMRTLATVLEEQRRAVQWRAEQWDQGARLSGILTYPGTMNPNKKQRFIEAWRAYTASKAGGTPILENGMEYKPIDRGRPIDSKDLEGRKLTDAEVASFYHIPPELVGARQGTFSNIAAFRQMLFGPTLGPILSRIEAAINAQIIPALAPAGAYAEFNRESALAGSFAEQASYLQKAVGAPYMTRAEARAIQNLPRIDDTDELIVPLNVIEGGLASPADTAPSNEPEWGGKE
ncbi:phage portal protein [Jonesiaceae bacterium BS-20]|uniref:Phage portal protein n=1 Tax=Jonesiaceae bacterium BS-20 TaxID=3120821 RepID=A0AAU7DUF8_9MICO